MARSRAACGSGWDGPQLEYNWELDRYSPRGLAKARMGDRPRIDPEQVRQAQPGEAWVIQAGQQVGRRRSTRKAPTTTATRTATTNTTQIHSDLVARQNPSPGREDDESADLRAPTGRCWNRWVRPR
ncbi:MAG: hypothetical protein M3N43_01515 [Actinomycetota bacterium]|nr:hypothetical protein [Actinomycetota bacterium]